MTDKKLKSALTTALALLLIWAGISVCTVGTVPAGIILSRLSPAIVAFLVAAWFFGRDRERRASLVCILLCAITDFEGCIGLGQLAGWLQPRHDIFPLTGDFYNPGLLGCLMAIGLCCSVTVLLRRPGRGIKVLAVCTAAFSLIVLALSESRASWLGAGVALVIVALHETTWFSKIRHKTAVLCIAAVLVLAAGAGAYALKPKSADARLHMWQISCLAMADHPMLGAGPGSELAAYMQAQEDFFRLKERDFDRQMAAGAPHTVFNEFLKIGVGSGIPALVLAIAVFALTLALLLRRRSPLAYALIAFGVFSLFSYPFTQVFFKIFTAVCIAEALSLSRASHKKCAVAQGVIAALLCAALVPSLIQGFKLSRPFGAIDSGRNPEAAVARYRSFDPQPEYNGGFMLEYGKALYFAKKYQEAIEILEEAALTNGDPALYITLGECYHSLGMPQEAQECFLKAHYRRPSLLSPMLSLMVLYYQYGWVDEARTVRDYGKSLPADKSLDGTKQFYKVIEKIEL